MLDLGHRGADELPIGTGLLIRLARPLPEAPAATRCCAASGGQVVQFEQFGELVGVLLVLSSRVDQRELAFHQRLAAAGQVD